MAAGGIGKLLWLANPGLGTWQGQIGSPGASFRIDASNKKFAYKFFVARTTAITHVKPHLQVAGTVTGMNFKAEIQSDDGSGVPSGTVLGGATAEWAGPAATGWLGETALTSNTGTLSLNTPYWLVVYYSSGGTPDASNYIGASRETGITRAFNDLKIRQHNGTDWTTVTPATTPGAFLLKDSNGLYNGFHITSIMGNHGSATDIFGTNRQALKMRFGSQVTLYGLRGMLTKTGSPGGLALRAYQGSTEKGAVGTLGALEVVSNDANSTILLGSPATIDPDQDCYLVLGQSSDGGSDANDYDMRGVTLESGFSSAFLPAQWRFCYGSGNDPTAFTEDANWVPYLAPIIEDPADDFDSIGGGGINRAILPSGVSAMG